MNIIGANDGAGEKTAIPHGSTAFNLVRSDGGMKIGVCLCGIGEIISVKPGVVKVSGCCRWQRLLPCLSSVLGLL